ncbi:MAG TPA: nucleotidyl transferase AbiEii/AbiGii toxin family protein [Terriglobales bacterium]|nr:nucleotidyl transferase AbiEii/AbiGii toxin family protein [Terriglobales bacterium]
MKPTNARNGAASVRQRLLNTAAARGEDFGLVLIRYALERLLYRLSHSDFRDQFVLKGAMLFQVWTDTPHRPTRDLDLLGRGDPSLEHCQEVFREICRIPVEDDGLIFSADTVSVEKIKEDQDYEGIRVKFLARLDNARMPVQVDVGFGDAVIPGLLDYPTLLPMSAPRIQAYPMETVVAEKTEAIVHLGMLNSRMKDFYDIWFLARTFSFDLGILRAALQATFDRRKTELESDRLQTLLAELSVDGAKRTQWRAFLRKSSLAAPDDFAIVNDTIRDFLMTPASVGRERAGTWPAGGPWQRREEPGPQPTA